jgi:hypothetical protein
MRYIIFGGFYDGKDTVGADTILDIIDGDRVLALSCATDYCETVEWIQVYDLKESKIVWRWDFEDG